MPLVHAALAWLFDLEEAVTPRALGIVLVRSVRARTMTGRDPLAGSKWNKVLTPKLKIAWLAFAVPAFAICELRVATRGPGRHVCFDADSR